MTEHQAEWPDPQYLVVIYEQEILFPYGKRIIQFNNKRNGSAPDFMCRKVQVRQPNFCIICARPDEMSLCA